MCSCSQMGPGHRSHSKTSEPQPRGTKHPANTEAARRGEERRGVEWRGKERRERSQSRKKEESNGMIEKTGKRQKAKVYFLESRSNYMHIQSVAHKLSIETMTHCRALVCLGVKCQSLR